MVLAPSHTLFSCLFRPPPTPMPAHPRIALPSPYPTSPRYLSPPSYPTTSPPHLYNTNPNPNLPAHISPTPCPALPCHVVPQNLQIHHPLLAAPHPALESRNQSRASEALLHPHPHPRCVESVLSPPCAAALAAPRERGEEGTREVEGAAWTGGANAWDEAQWVQAGVAKAPVSRTRVETRELCAALRERRWVECLAWPGRGAGSLLVTWCLGVESVLRMRLVSSGRSQLMNGLSVGVESASARVHTYIRSCTHILTKCIVCIFSRKQIEP
ncbi:hypothetical protein BDV95DRAFT_260715 [Massariosphaeria phaeospora]|uniref:Uncharacterized protein n=1 Tax=Massariosphaeria phaeospora TaxID=100035 RepID=A0A7C8HYP0_9PLEO|nr:hypothetical protein BDV95DRAFT_260715 [Massariosphaeria phaeospora]